jgi:hypothetical protein
MAVHYPVCSLAITFTTLQFSHYRTVLTKAVVPCQRVTESDLIGNTCANSGNYNQQVVGSESTELNFQLN